MQMLILTVFMLILSGAFSLLATTFINDGSKIIEALSGQGVTATGGSRKSHKYRVAIVNFADREMDFNDAVRMRKSSADHSIRLIVSNEGCVNADQPSLNGSKSGGFSPRIVRAPRDQLAA
jgi:hypothetical protein